MKTTHTQAHNEHTNNNNTKHEQQRTTQRTTTKHKHNKYNNGRSGGGHRLAERRLEGQLFAGENRLLGDCGSSSITNKTAHSSQQQSASTLVCCLGWRTTSYHHGEPKHPNQATQEMLGAHVHAICLPGAVFGDDVFFPSPPPSEIQGLFCLVLDECLTQFLVLNCLLGPMLGGGDGFLGIIPTPKPSQQQRG